MASRIIAFAVLCFVTPNPGFGSGGTSLVVSQKQTYASAYSKVVTVVSEKADVVNVSTSVIRTSPVMAVSAKPSMYVGENAVDSSLVSKPIERVSTETAVSPRMATSPALSPSAVTPPLYVDEASSSMSSVMLKPKTLTTVTAASTETEIKTSFFIFIETSTLEPSKPMPHSPTETPAHIMVVTTSSHRISSSLRVSESPTSSPPTPSAKSVDYKLILCVAVPLVAVLVFVIVIAMVLCIRRYRKLRRYRQHLVPLTDMDGSDDSDEDDQISDKEPVFMVSAINSSARPILSFENEND